MKSITSRYVKMKGHTGIRKDLSTGKYNAYKKLKGSRYSANFDNLRQAIQWRLTFIPVEEKALALKMTIGELIHLYIEGHLSNLASSTRGVRLDRIKIFTELHTMEVESLTPEIIKQFFQREVTKAKKSKSRRMNYDQEIKDLRAILNWYRETYNYKYVVPVIAKKLRASCVISQAKKVKQKLTADEFLQFFDALDPFYKDVALIQSRIAGRIGEVAGLQFKSIDLVNRSMLMKDVVVYGRKKEFIELKPNPKSAEVRSCYITDDMLEAINRRLPVKSSSSDYVFHINGEPLKYRSVQHAYDSALKRAGLYHKTSGTHMLRHFTATLTRLVCGSLDAVQAVTGHKSVKLVQHYGTLSSTLQGESISKVELHLKQRSNELSFGCSQGVQKNSTGKQMDQGES